MAIISSSIIPLEPNPVLKPLAWLAWWRSKYNQENCPVKTTEGQKRLKARQWEHVASLPA